MDKSYIFKKSTGASSVFAFSFKVAHGLRRVGLVLN